MSAAHATPTPPVTALAPAEPLRFITCGSVDDGKSTLIGRLLVDSQAVLQDQLSSVQRQGSTDLALLTDGLSAEREQGITIDVAWRYFASPARKFIIGDTPGHAQYTRNMVTAASVADAAVVLVDATKLPWAHVGGASGSAHPPNIGTQGTGVAPAPALLEQTRRHLLLLQLLRVPAVVVAVNKLDALAQPQQAFEAIRAALLAFASEAGLPFAAIVPTSALIGHNVVHAKPGWCGYEGPSLLQWLQSLPSTLAAVDEPLAFPVQWIDKFADAAHTEQGRRVLWGRVAQGSVQAGDAVQVFPSGQQATVVEVKQVGGAPDALKAQAGWSVGLVLDRELDISRGDWLLAGSSHLGQDRGSATVAWMDEEPLTAGRTYWVLHGHRWVKARVERVLARRNLLTLANEAADQLQANDIGRIQLRLQAPVPWRGFAQSRNLGAMILVDTASHRTAGAVLLDAPPA